MTRLGPHQLITLTFAVLLLSVGGVQWGIDWRRGERPQALDLFHRVPTVAHLRLYEEELERASWIADRLGAWIRQARFVFLNDPGEKALVGPNGWFFYRPGVEYVTQRIAFPPDFGDPVTAILKFRDQLAARGIELILMPTPNKESIYPEELVRRADARRDGMAEPVRELMQRLEAANVEVLDLFALFIANKDLRDADRFGEAGPLYLAQDSHWSPAGLQLASRAMAQRLLERGWVGPGQTEYRTEAAPTPRVGDIVRMLKLPAVEARLGPETVHCTRVVQGDSGEPYADDPAAGILVLGDSFLRIFQQDEPGAAGFVAHLARHLQQPVTALINDGGASTLVRQQLHRRPELLRNKRVVIWSFVERDLRLGSEGWQNVPLPDL
jgi:lysophospholipase L1-like esterase